MSGEQATVAAASAVAGSLPGPASGEDALDLGATVVPVLVKGYWKQALGGLAVAAFLIWLIRRR